MKNISTIIVATIIFSYSVSLIFENSTLFVSVSLISFPIFLLINFVMEKTNVKQLTKVCLINIITIGSTIISFIFLENIYISIGILIGTISVVIISIYSIINKAGYN
ncbi:hypothetical protein C6W20_18770 [Bacillus sp. NMCN6]|nr:hypothetical protein CHI05_18405 [Bacillus sp. 7788]PRR95136.1 hypothetical protein C6W20_18770 [Bacillus sp. NMCN6]